MEDIYADQTDEQVILLVQGGDIEAFGAILRRFEPKLLRYAQKFLIDGNDAEDLAQEVFIKAYTNIRGFDATRRFSPWLYRIAHNVFLNAIKKRGTDRVSFFDIDVLLPIATAKERADDAVKKEELHELLDRYLRKIDRKYREPLVLYYFEDLDYHGISEALKIPVSTVGVRLQRGRAQLQKLARKEDEKL